LSAQKAYAEALPKLQAELERRIVTSTQDVLISVLGTTPPAPPSATDFLKADARSRAIRHFLIGLGLAAVWGFLGVLGQLAGLNWFDHDTWPEAFAIVLAAVAGSMVSYVARLVKVPDHLAPVEASLPGPPPASSLPPPLPPPGIVRMPRRGP
jgi:hypothetical protein